MGSRFWSLGFVALAGSFGCAFDEQQPMPDQPVQGFGGSSALPSGPISAGTPGFGGGVFPGQPPVPGPVFSAAQTPPPVSGGTLLVLGDQVTAVVSDPDHDQLVIVDLAAMSVTHTIALPAASEPARGAEDATGQVHVVLRGSGQLVTIDPKAGEVIGTRDVCRYPRGLAVAPAESAVHVACMEGRLVTLSTDVAVTAPNRDVALDRDVRDVVVAAEGLWVSRFRSAEVLRLDASGAVVHRYELLGRADEGLGASRANVAWRMVANPNVEGGVIVVHQRAFGGEVIPQPGGYGSNGKVGGIVESTVSEVHDDGTVVGATAMVGAALPVDVAYSPASDRLALASATFEHSEQPRFSQRSLLVPREQFALAPTVGPVTNFAFGEDIGNPSLPSGPVVAVAFANDVPVMQLREPSSLIYGWRGLSLPGGAVTDTGNTLFHLETSSGIACASCHPEGMEDGHVWKFAGFGERRTQAIRGGLLGTEPFHWDGVETDFQMLTNDVMSTRMGGPQLTPEQAGALAGFIDRLPAFALPASAMTEQAARGKALFEDASVGCATCHNGPRFTDNKTVDVGRGALQVPGLLGLWARAPYLHDGCAKTLADRFTTACHDAGHGNIEGLTADDLTALTAYLDTL